jgi:hypothetical protein
MAIVLLLCLTANTALAGTINGIAGYLLGDRFNPRKAVAQHESGDGASVYTVRPRKSDALIERLALRLTPQGQIHRISAFSPPMSAAACQLKMDSLRKQTERQFPSLGYYAMDQSELFYEGDRTYTLECIHEKGKVRLRQEYSDDKLAKQKK